MLIAMEGPEVLSREEKDELLQGILFLPKCYDAFTTFSSENGLCHHTWCVLPPARASVIIFSTGPAQLCGASICFVSRQVRDQDSLFCSWPCFYFPRLPCIQEMQCLANYHPNRNISCAKK